MQKILIEAMERRLLPDFVIRYGIRKLCQERLDDLKAASQGEIENQEAAYAESLRQLPLAVHTQEANEQHYELPPHFFELVLGKNLKYSSAYWNDSCKTLADAEDQALQITIQRAELQDGMRILELGCGWGSLTLAMAKKFPKSQIIALSNSAPQRLYIEGELKRLKLENVQVITRNIMDTGDLSKEFFPFDRVVSVEMFEHLKNYDLLLSKLSQWLDSEGKLFVHVFTHRDFSYPFEVEGESNWMGKYFFTGGQMPARKLFSYFKNSLTIETQWEWNGTHYGKTSEAWLRNMDTHSDEIKKLFDQTYGIEQSKRWVQRWRVFFMSCAELFNYRHGSEWGVSHYLFQKIKQ